MSDAVFNEFPKMLVNEASGATCIVKNPAEEEKRFAEGYSSPGRSDPHAFEMAHSGAPAAYRAVEFPKWVNGVLCTDAKQERAALAGKMRPVDPYPMTITIGNGQQIVVKDRADHERMLGPALDAPPAPPKRVEETPAAAEWAEFQQAQTVGAVPGQAA